MSARDAVIVEAVRSPVGKRNGGLSGVHPVSCPRRCSTALAERAGIDPAIVDDVIWGCVMQAGEQALDIARTAVLAAGWPETVPGVTVDRQCGSSQQSIHFAAAGVVAGPLRRGGRGRRRVDVPRARWGVAANGPAARTARGVPERYGQTFQPGHRRRDDRRAVGPVPRSARRVLLGSHAKAAAAQDEGRFDGQIAPVKDQDGNRCSRDEGIRRGTTMEKMAELKPAFKEDGVIHAGNSSQISDGSAALLFMSAEKASVGAQAARQGAHRDAGRRRPGDHADRADPGHPEGAEEVRPAHRATSACSRSTRLSPRCRWPGWPTSAPTRRRLNPNGGAIALGHPLGGSGARIMTTLVHHMRDKGIRYGLQTMCEGGGQANATILERIG